MIPKNEGSQPVWLENFAAKIPLQGPNVGLLATEITSAVNDCNYLKAIYLQVLKQLRTSTQTMTSYKNLIKNGTGTGMPFPSLPVFGALPTAVLPGVIARLRALIARIMNHPAYTVAIGIDLGIDGTSSPAPTEPSAPPVFHVTDTNAGNVTLPWEKDGWTGVKVQSRHPTDATWTDLGTDLFSPFVDTRPLAVANQPEIREYRMIYLDGDATTGDWSMSLSVNVNP